MSELLAQQEHVVGLQPTYDRLGERVPLGTQLGTQLPSRQLGERPRVGFAVAQPLQDLARRDLARSRARARR
jgi:hypothetical protein